MLRYKLRTLLILLAVLPPLLWIGWTKYEAWRVEREHRRLLREAMLQLLLPDSPDPPPPSALFTVKSGPDEVLKSLGSPPPGHRWMKIGNGIGAVPIGGAVPLGAVEIGESPPATPNRP